MTHLQHSGYSIDSITLSLALEGIPMHKERIQLLQYKLLAACLKSRKMEDEQKYINITIEGLALPTRQIRGLCETILNEWIETNNEEEKARRKIFVQQQLYYKVMDMSDKTSQFFRQALETIKFQ